MCRWPRPTGRRARRPRCHDDDTGARTDQSIPGPATGLMLPLTFLSVYVEQR